MEVMIERCAFLDVHRDTAVACVRIPDGAGGRRKQIRTFGTMTSQLWEVPARLSLVLRGPGFRTKRAPAA